MIDRAASNTEYGIESFRNSCIMMDVGQQYNIWMRISVSRDLAMFVFFLNPFQELLSRLYFILNHKLSISVAMSRWLETYSWILFGIPSCVQNRDLTVVSFFRNPVVFHIYRG